jgi:hypothetical protein
MRKLHCSLAAYIGKKCLWPKYRGMRVIRCHDIRTGILFDAGIVVGACGRGFRRKPQVFTTVIQIRIARISGCCFRTICRKECYYYERGEDRSNHFYSPRCDNEHDPGTRFSFSSTPRGGSQSHLQFCNFSPRAKDSGLALGKGAGSPLFWKAATPWSRGTARSAYNKIAR